MNHGLHRLSVALRYGLVIGVLLLHAGCDPTTSSTTGTTTTSDAFAALATFAADFVRQLLAAFLF